MQKVSEMQETEVNPPSGGAAVSGSDHPGTAATGVGAGVGWVTGAVVVVVGGTVVGGTVVGGTVVVGGIVARSGSRYSGPGPAEGDDPQAARPRPRAKTAQAASDGLRLRL
jgi:hypothetical protein